MICYLNLNSPLELYNLIRDGGCLVISVLALYSDDPRSNPAKVYIYCYLKLLEKNENKWKRPS